MGGGFINKRIIFFIVLGLFISFISGCKKEKILDAPKNVYLDEEEILRWDKVDNATSYVVSVNNELLETSENSMDLFEILNEYKTYTIGLYAKSSEKKYLESDNVYIKYTLEENELEYELKNNQYIVSTQDPEKIKGKVIIPKFYNGKVVTGIKSRAFENCINLTKVIIPGSDDKYGSYIKDYGSNIFKNCTNLVRAKLDDDLEEIPARLFYGCSSLKYPCFTKSVKIINSLAYYRCNSLKNVYIPDGVEKVSDAFLWCENLESISFPESINKKISSSDFRECHNLQTIEIRGNNELYYSENNCLIEKASKKLIVGCINSIIPSDVTTIGRKAFETRYIEKVEIGENIQIIEEEAFNSCLYLQSVRIEGTKEIGNECFYNCSRLTNVEIINVDVLNEGCFAFCKSLEKLNLESVRIVKAEAFNECINLKEIVFSEKLEDLKYFNTNTSTNILFNNHDYYIYDNDCVIDKRTNTLICGTDNSIIPEYIQIIGEYSFKDRKMESIVIPNGVETIDKHAFENCLFKTIKFPKSLKRIEAGAFFNCPNLLYVTIPSNIEFIGGSAFNVRKIMTVIFDGFDGVLEKNAFPYHTVYTDVVCDDFQSMFDNKWGSSPFFEAQYVVYNTVFKEDKGEKYVYSIDLKNISVYPTDTGYATCYREGYKFLGWSFTENSTNVDIPIKTLERYIYDNYQIFQIKEIRKFYGFAKEDYVKLQKEYTNTTLYAVWEKIDK